MRRGKVSDNISQRQKEFFLIFIHLRSPRSLSIQYGLTEITSDYTNVINVADGIYHEDYDPYRGYANDIAILKLESEIPLSNLAVPAVLPKQGDATPENKPAILVGWGLNYVRLFLMK